jgi:hypothetical protein
MTEPAQICVLVCERRFDSSLWPVVTVDLPVGQPVRITGRKSAGLAVPYLRAALMAAEAQSSLNPPTTPA